MKKTSKLLAFVIVFSMILSTMVMPVSATGGTTLYSFTEGFNTQPDFTTSSGNDVIMYAQTRTIATSATVYDLAKDPNKTTKLTSELTGVAESYASYTYVADPLDSNNKVVKITPTYRTKNYLVNDYTFVKYLTYNISNMAADSYYYLSVDAMAADATELATVGSRGVTIRTNLTTSATHNTSTSTLSTTAWSTAECIVGKNYYTASKNSGADTVYVQVGGNNARGIDYYVDNFKIREIKMLETENLELSGTLKIAGPAELDLIASGMSITDGKNSVTPSSVTYDSTNGVWLITYVGLAELTDYTLIITNSLGKEMTKGSTYDKRMKFSFKTKDLNLLASLTTLLYQNPDTAGLDELAKDTTDTDAWLLNRSAGGVQGAITKLALTEGMVYEFKASVKKAATSTEDTTVKMYLYGDYGTERDELLNDSLTVTDEYQTFRGTFKVTGQAGEAKHHIGLLASEGTDNLLIKDFKLLEVAKFIVATSKVANPDSATVTFAFSAPLEADLSESDLTISGGAATIADITKDGNAYTVHLEDLEETTEYTIELTGEIKDAEYGQIAACDPVVFTTPEPVPVPLTDYKGAGGWDISSQYPNASGDLANNTLTGTGAFCYWTCKLPESYELTNTSDLPDTKTEKQYLISMEAKDYVADGNSPKITNYFVSNPCYETTTTALNCQNVVLDEEWTKVSFIVTIGTAESATTPGYCRCNTTKHLKRAGGDHDPRVNLGFTFQTATDDMILFQNFKVTEYHPFDIEEIGLSDGDINVNSDASINVKFSSKPYKFLAENIVVTDANGDVVADAATTKKIDDTNYVITLADLDTGSKYTLEFKDVVDMHAQTLSYKAGFTTSVTSNLIKKGGFDAGYEDETVPTTFIGDGVSAAIVGQESDISPTQGDYQLKLSNLTDGAGVYFAGIGTAGDQVQLEAGKKYQLKFDVAAVPNADGSASSGSVTPYFEDIDAETNTVIVSETDAEAVDVDSSGWTTVVATVTIADNEDGTAYKGINVGLTADGVSAIYVDNWDLREVIPSFDMSFSIANNEEAATTNEVIITFTNAPTEFTQSHITSDSTITVVKLTNKKYKVTIGTFANEATYSIEVDNVCDEYGQIVTGESLSFKTAAAPSSFNEGVNLADGVIDYSYENGTISKYTDAGEPMTVVTAADEGIDLPDSSFGSKLLKIETTPERDAATTSVRFYGFKNVEIGKRYKISYWIRTVNAGETTTAALDRSSGYPTTNSLKITDVDLQEFNVSNEWTQVYGIVDVIPTDVVGGVNQGFHFGVRTGKIQDVPVYVDKFVVEEIKPDFKISTTFENKQSGMPTDEIVIPVEFSHTPWGVDVTNVDITSTLAGEPVVANSTVKIEKVDYRNYNIVLSDLDLKTTYTVDLTGVIDVYGASPVVGGEFTPVTFTTNFGEGVPEFTLVSDPENDEDSHGSEIVTLTFSNKPVSFVKDTNVTVKKDGANVDYTINVVSENEEANEFIYTLQITEPEYDTEYTVSIDVMDIDGQQLEKDIVFKTRAQDGATQYNTLNGVKDYGFENAAIGPYTSQVGSAGTYSVVGTENGATPYEGSQMFKAVGGGADSYLVRFANSAVVEIGKEYVVSFHARTIDDGATGTASVYTGSSNLSSNILKIEAISTNSVAIDNEWKKVSAQIKVIANPDYTVETPTNIGFHLGAVCKNADIYIDNFAVIELPQTDFAISSAIPADNAKQVKVDTNQIVINYSAEFDKDFDPATDGEFKLYKGDVDVTADVVDEVVTSFTKTAIFFNFKSGVVLDNNATYKVIAKGVTDYVDRVLDSELVFTTAPAIVTEDPVITATDENGSALEEIVPASVGVNYITDISEAEIEYTNFGSGAVNKPLYIYTLYDGDELVKAGSTVFDRAISLPQYGTDSLSLDLTGLASSITPGMTLTLYLVNSFNSLYLAAEPIVFEFVAP